MTDPAPEDTPPVALTTDQIEDRVRAALALENRDIYDDDVTVLDHYTIAKVMNADGEIELRIYNSTQNILTSEVYGWLGWALEMTRLRIHKTTDGEV